ncbi:APC membrane recruitment protein 2 [Betta splendens]|uniref:APC membrane recruitment protein 2 n=1 Tax=Betta splendens TaxID=158456 RepID=A0A6P7P9M5_BETSP|nr:APC membrane recruitment protein 2 [Betta splendens]XP_029029412.1 APC membrane recruitment protein 2 [Betta splendens]
MDVQTENMDPPPCESQPSGKIRKGFKLFGKHKPGNIFSIRSKADGNNKSPVPRSKAADGASEAAADSEQEPDKEKGQEASVAERQQAEEEPLGEDGVLAAAPARTSISSASSAKSLGFLSRLRGGRRGAGERRAHTVSQPTGRQRRGLKGLFGNVRFRSKDKDDREDSPPSPLLMSSRANSVEIIKEDLTLTPRSQPRSLDSPEAGPAGDSAATSPSETATPRAAAGDVSRTERASPLPGCELPLAPGDTSLSSLLADISSLLTFDSISGGGDIMADVEAEWGRVSSALSAGVPPPSTSPPVKPPHVPAPAASTHYFAPLTKLSTFSPAAKPSSGSTTLTQPLTSTPPSVKLSSDSTAVSETSTSVSLKSAPTATKPAAHVALTSPSAPITSSSAVTMKSTLSSTSPNTQAPVVTAPSISPTLSAATKPALSNAAPAQVPASAGKPAPVATPAPPAKPPPVTHSPPTPAPASKPDSVSGFQTSTSYKPSLNAAAGEPKAPVTVSARADLTTPSSPEPVFPSKTTIAPTSTATSASVSVAPAKSTMTSTKTDVKTPPSLVTLSSSAPITTAKAQPGPPSVPAPPSASSDKISSMTKPTPAPVALDMMPPAPTPTPFAAVSPTPPDRGPIPLVHFKAPPASVLNNSSAPTQVHGDQPKAPAAPAQTSVPVSKEQPVPTLLPGSGSKEPPPPGHVPASVCKDLHIPALTSVSHSKDPFVPAHCPVASPPSTSPHWSAKGSGPAAVDGLTSPSSRDTHGGQAVSSKTEKIQNESRTSLQGSREKKAPQVKASGLSKIPVVGGGRGGKLPVSQQGDDEASRVPPSPVQEERPPFYSHDPESRDKIFAAEANVATSKDAQEGSQQPPQPKVPASLPRDSKIPVKHSTQSHAASHNPQAKEPLRSKIPVSKVPVRTAAKPAAAGGRK